MKKICLVLFMIFCTFNVSALNVDEVCNNEYLEPFIKIVSMIINGIKIGVPIILIILGMIDMGKAVASQKDEKIKGAQKTLISRLLTGAIVFFIVAIIQLLLNIIASSSGDNDIWKCVCKFVGAKCPE